VEQSNNRAARAGASVVDARIMAAQPEPQPLWDGPIDREHDGREPLAAMPLGNAAKGFALKS